VSEFLAGAVSGTYVLLDCFTDAPLAGNQLAVFLARDEPLEATLMQRIARELNLSETVFLETTSGPADARARIFTPQTELPFAGHPVLGAAVVEGFAERDKRVVLETAAALVPVELDWDGAAPFGRMEQPLPSWEPCERAGAVLAALGGVRSLLPVETYTNGPRFAIVVLESEAALAALAPDPAALLALGAIGVYCAAARGAAWEVRMFAPAFGVSEDPATGSGAGLLATHLARHGLSAFSQDIEIHQGLRIGRPSLLHARVSALAGRVVRVEVGGSAVIVGSGELALPGRSV
jgi:trans-2,3-dihydro-3-hydroxyanthranilate isomerase